MKKTIKGIKKNKSKTLKGGRLFRKKGNKSSSRRVSNHGIRRSNRRSGIGFNESVGAVLVEVIEDVLLERI